MRTILETLAAASSLLWSSIERTEKLRGRESELARPIATELDAIVRALTTGGMGMSCKCRFEADGLIEECSYHRQAMSEAWNGGMDAVTDLLSRAGGSMPVSSARPILLEEIKTLRKEL